MTKVVALDDVRRALEGADRAYPEDGRGNKNPPGPPSESNVPQQCPITCTGHRAGHFNFLDKVGQERSLPARSLGNKHELLALFHGDDTWPRAQFPKRAIVKRQHEDGTESTEEIVIDFLVNRLAAFLMQQCSAAGLYGDHLVLRRPGVWPDGDGCPAVHCGDAVRIGDAWHDAGYRTQMPGGKTTIWAAASPVQRPGVPCEASIARKLQDDLRDLFRFRQPGGPIAVLGVLGTAFFGAVPRWRPSCFLVGVAGCGKSTLARLLATVSPMHSLSNDTSKAGLIGAVNGRAMLCVIDENEKSDDSRGSAARTLMDLVLTSSGGDGTQGLRGNVDGTFRRIEMVGSFVMAATSVPEMRDTHHGRIAIIEMEAPAAGEDFRIQHEALIERMRPLGPRLWSRALGAWERYQASLVVFRNTLQTAGCAPREMDQCGAILAGWWILTHEGVATERHGREGVAALAGFVRTADQVAENSNAIRLVQYLMTYAVQLDRSTAREAVGGLIERVFAYRVDPDFALEAKVAENALHTHGIRVIHERDPADKRQREVPRLGPNGIWVNPGCTELRRVFEGSEWAGGRWVTGLLELDNPRSKRAGVTVKIGSATCRPIWVPFEHLGIEPSVLEQPTHDSRGRAPPPEDRWQ